MAPEEFRIKIMKTGEVLVDLRGLGEQRVRDLRRMLEEIVGPVIEEVAVSDDGPSGQSVRILTDEREERYRIQGP